MYKPKAFRQLNKQFVNSTQASLNLSKKIQPLINDLVHHIEKQKILEQYQSTNKINNILRLVQIQLSTLQQTFKKHNLLLQFQIHDLFQNCQKEIEQLNQKQKQIVVENIYKNTFRIEQQFKPLEYLISKLKSSRI